VPFPFKASAAPRASEESEGFAKVLADAVTDEILGIPPLRTARLGHDREAVLAMEYAPQPKTSPPFPRASDLYEAIKESSAGATENRRSTFNRLF